MSPLPAPDRPATPATAATAEHLSAAPAAAPSGLVEALAAAGVAVITDPDVLAGHCVDWTGRWVGPALAAARPTSAEQVAAVLAAARAAGAAVQVQGGNTGLVGGSVPDRPSLLLLTAGLDHIEAPDPDERTVVVGAGVTAARLAEAARASGLRFGVDLAARDSATVGGMVATNAGGMGVSAYGMMRDQVRGLVAVLADGRVVRTVGRPRKDNCGFDLAGLLAGSEGTLGVITQVEVALHAPPPQSTVALVAVTDLAEAVRCARVVEAQGWPLLAAEVVDAAGVARAAVALGQPDPLDRGTDPDPGAAGWLLVLEVADGATAQGLASVGERVVAVAVDPADRQRLWALRERQSELYAVMPELQKLDVSVRLADLDHAVSAIRALVADARARTGPGANADARARPGPGANPGGDANAGAGLGPTGAPGADDPSVGFFGHALDGNLHVQLVGMDVATGDRVLEVVSALGGSISAEHGIGRAKAASLHLARSPEQIDWMRAIKASVDPAGLLNPGVLFGSDQT